MSNISEIRIGSIIRVKVGRNTILAKVLEVHEDSLRVCSVSKNKEFNVPSSRVELDGEQAPDKTRLVHKMAQGNLDLETGLSEANLRSILSSWNKESIMVVQTGKSFVLRIPVPQLNRLEGFSAQMAIVSEVFSGISLFRDCMVEYGLKQKERTHVSAMEHVKATPDEVKATKTEKNTTINKEV